MKTIAKKNVGFTLIELLVVISIIALLLAILMPALGKVKEKAKLLVCSSNQKQLLLAVNTYAASNDGRYPQHIAESPTAPNPFEWPNRMNYHADRNNPEGALYTHLGGYIEQAKFFNCPLAVNIDETEYQRQYSNFDEYSDLMTFASYSMYWGGYQFPPINFVGPRSQSSKGAKLMTSDIMNYYESATSWQMSHPSKDCGKAQDENYPLWIREGKDQDDVPDLSMSAGYTDGHVERYNAKDTIGVSREVPRFFYIPVNWK